MQEVVSKTAKDLNLELKTNTVLFEDIDYFLGSRDIYPHVQKALKQIEAPFKGTLNRGLLYPKHLLEVGNIVEEWHGCTHWSKNFRIAEDFLQAGYVAEDYITELEKDVELMARMGATTGEDLFVKVMFKIIDAPHGIDIHTTIKGLGMEWEREQEVIMMGYDFEIQCILYPRNVEEKDYYIVYVKEKVDD